MSYGVDPEDVVGGGGEGVLSQLGQGAMHGLGYVAGLLDKPGRSARALLDTLFGSGQHSQDILAAIPFAENLGLTTSEQQIGGAELAKNITGYDPTQGTWAERNLVGPAVEIATDPTTWLGGVGALTKAGKTARAAGHMPAGLLDEGFLAAVGRGERSIYGLRGQTVENLIRPVAETTESVARAMPGVDPALEALGKARTGLRSLFSAEYGPIAQADIQAATKGILRPGEKAAMAQVGSIFAPLQRRQEELLAAGVDPQQWAAYLGQRAAGTTPGSQLQPFLQSLSPEAHALAGEITQFGGLDPRAVQTAAGFATPQLADLAGVDPLAELAGQHLAAGERAARGEAFYDILGRTAQPAAQLPGGTPVSQLLTDLGLGTATAEQRAAQALGLANPAALAGHHVAPELVPQLEKFLSGAPAGWKTPQIFQAMDPYLKMFKRGVYSIWPGAQVENDITGRLANLTEHAMHPLDRAYGIAEKALQGGEVDTRVAGLAHLAPVEQAQALVNEAWSHGAIGGGKGGVGRLAAETTAFDPFAMNPLAPRPGLGAIGGQLVKDLRTGKWVQPLAEEAALPQAGQAVNRFVEDRLRLGLYTKLRQQGFLPQAAADAVNATHFDYGKGLTEFERTQLAPLMTFPQYSRFNIPKQVGMAVTNPGKVMAQLRLGGATGAPEQEDVYRPDWMQSSLNLPMGEVAPGVQQFLGGVGLGVQDLARTPSNLLGMLRPEIKVPTELLSGRQLETGRELTDIRPGPIVGNLPVDKLTQARLTELLGILPTSRLGGTAAKAIDPRTYEYGILQGFLNQVLPLLTGAQTYNVETERARTRDERAAVNQLLELQPHLRQAPESYYAPAELKPELTDEEVALLAVQKANAARARARKRQESMAGY